MCFSLAVPRQARHASDDRGLNRARPVRGRLGGQFTKFAAVGALNTGLSLGAYTLLLALGAPYLPASVCAFTAGALNGYRLNRKWTFRAGPSNAASLTRYLAVRLGGIGLNSVLLVLLVEVVTLGPFIAQVVALPTVSGLAFYASRHWVFRAAEATTS